MMSGVGTFHDRGIDITKLNDRKNEKLGVALCRWGHSESSRLICPNENKLLARTTIKYESTMEHRIERTSFHTGNKYRDVIKIARGKAWMVERGDVGAFRTSVIRWNKNYGRITDKQRLVSRRYIRSIAFSAATSTYVSRESISSTWSRFLE